MKRSDFVSLNPLRLCGRSFGRRTIAVVCALAILLSAPVYSVLAQNAGDPDRVGVAELDPKAEQAIDAALRFLAKKQGQDGSWGGQYKCANTAVALMAFMLKGHFPERGEYGELLNKGVGYLLSQAKAGEGYMGVNMYEHGLGTLALSEAWGMSTRKEIRDALKKAVDVILRSQATSGGWRYQPMPIDADVSVTVMQIVALSSAKEAGIYVPDKTITKAIAYVKSLQTPEGGFGYMGASSPGFARSAAGVMSLLMCGEGKSKAVQKGLQYLNTLPKSVFKNEQYFFYGHYYAIQAMYQAGEGNYQKWYPQIRDALIQKQGKDGAWNGGEGGTEFTTAVGVLILGVPYRYLPIYQR